MSRPAELLTFAAIYALFLGPLVFIAVAVYRSVRAPKGTPLMPVRTAWPVITVVVAVMVFVQQGNVPYSVRLQTLTGLLVIGIIEWGVRRWLIQRA